MDAQGRRALAANEQVTSKEINVKIHLLLLAGAIMAGPMLMQCGCKPEGTSCAQKACMRQVVYVCPDCRTMALKACTCACGKEMVEEHMLGMKDGKVLACDCPASCACGMAGINDGKCSCGKPVQKVSAKGLYVCACADGKCGATISDKPGKCGCGADLKKVE